MFYGKRRRYAYRRRRPTFRRRVYRKRRIPFRRFRKSRFSRYRRIRSRYRRFRSRRFRRGMSGMRRGTRAGLTLLSRQTIVLLGPQPGAVTFDVGSTISFNILNFQTPSIADIINGDNDLINQVSRYRQVKVHWYKFYFKFSTGRSPQSRIYTDTVDTSATSVAEDTFMQLKQYRFFVLNDTKWLNYYQIGTVTPTTDFPSSYNDLIKAPSGAFKITDVLRSHTSRKYYPRMFTVGADVGDTGVTPLYNLPTKRIGWVGTIDNGSVTPYNVRIPGLAFGLTSTLRPTEMLANTGQPKVAIQVSFIAKVSFRHYRETQ